MAARFHLQETSRAGRWRQPRRHGHLPLAVGGDPDPPSGRAPSGRVVVRVVGSRRWKAPRGGTSTLCEAWGSGRGRTPQPPQTSRWTRAVCPSGSERCQWRKWQTSPVSSGYIVDGKGYIVDSKGYIVDGKGYIVDGKGYIVDGKGYIVDGKGYIVDGTVAV
eukprot:1179022-Prorocentrum_minimum.AAC.1